MADEMIPAQPTTNGLAQFAPDQRTWTSLNLQDPNQAYQFLKAKAAHDLTADDVLNKPFRVEHALVHTVEMHNHETGEVKPAVRTVLIAPDSTSVGFVSLGVAGSLRDLVSVWGMMPWKGGRLVVLERRKAKVVGHFYILLPWVETNGSGNATQDDQRASGGAARGKKGAGGAPKEP